MPGYRCAACGPCSYPFRSWRGQWEWWYVFGSASLTMLIIQIVTGIALAMVYVPSADQAYASLLCLNYDHPCGWFLRAAALLRRQRHDDPRAGAHDAGFPARRVQVSARVDVAGGRSPASYARWGCSFLDKFSVGTRMPIGDLRLPGRWPDVCRNLARTWSMCFWAAP